ncbi:MAG: retropepsin-like domain-containing protein [Alphaproteobacteria bacterium]|nr:retropepsin-like domain-containing protein [Alphaproteobacteria bacterium]
MKYTYVMAALLLATALPASADGVIPLDTSGPRPTAKLTIGTAAPVSVIFDSGAGGSVLNKEVGARHRLPDEGTVHISSPGAANPIPAYFSRLPAARLGDADVSGARVVIGDLGVPLPRISGVMSPNIFSGSLVRFELSKSRIVVMPKSPSSIPSAAANSYHGAHPLPAMEIDVAGVKLQAHLDTGNGRGFSLPLEIADRFSLQTPLTPAKPVKMAGGERKAFLSRIKGKVRVGPIELIDPEVTFIERFEYANVGFSILKDWTLVLDPAEQRCWLIAPER